MYVKLKACEIRRGGCISTDPKIPKTLPKPRFFTDLFLQTQHLVPLEVGKLPPLVAVHPALRKCAVRPLLLDLLLLPRSLQRTIASSTGKRLEDDRSEGNMRERSGMARDCLSFGFRGTVDQDLCNCEPPTTANRSKKQLKRSMTYALVVDNLDNCGYAACI